MLQLSIGKRQLINIFRAVSKQGRQVSDKLAVLQAVQLINNQFVASKFRHKPLCDKLIVLHTLLDEGLLGEAVSCSFCHRDVTLILAYSWARPVVLAAGKG